MTQLGEVSKEVDPKVGRVLRDFLSQLFSRVISPSSFLVIEFHVIRELELEEPSLEGALEKDPESVYEAIASVLRGKMYLEHMDLMLSNYLGRKFGILPEGERVLERLKEGDVRGLLKLADEYFKRVSEIDR